MEAFVRKDMDFTSQYLVREGLDKLVDIFRGISLIFSLTMQEDWPKQRQALLKSIKEKEERLKDFERRFLPTTIEEERLIVKEKILKKEVDAIKSKIATVKQEVEVLKLRKRLQELEEENAALSSLQ